ncbi:hypothetical protein [Streptomyces sp. NPDC003943]
MSSSLRALAAASLLLPAALAGSPAAAQAPGEAAASQTVDVLNGDFADPATTAAGPTTVGLDFWNGLNQRFSPSASGRTDDSYGVGLDKGGNTLSQRLRGVRKGAQVTVSYEDSPSVSKDCTGEQVASGQPYSVQGSGGTVTDVTTAGDPDRVKGKPGSGVWTKRTYAFTANENEPMLAFTSRLADPKIPPACSPMIARVRAVEVPPALDKTVDKTDLGRAEAFKGNEREATLSNAARACNGENSCVFRPDFRTSFRYYDRARVVGEAFVNCTRNTLEHTRVVSFAERAYDSVSQTYAADGIALIDAAKLPTTGDRTEDEKRIKSTPIAAQFSLAYEKGWQRAWQWFSGEQRNVVEHIQPGEVSWIELQPSRERVEGWFLSKKDDYRLHAVIDGPSRGTPDRLLQRTGPMAEAEKQRCAADRPMTTTPVGAGAAAYSTDKGVRSVPVPDAGQARARAIRTVPLN